MRRRIRIVGFYLILAACAAAWSSSRLSLPKVKARPLQIPEGAVPRTVYHLDSTSWTTFRIPATTNRVTILSRAHFKDETVPHDTFFPYDVIYRLENLDGEMVTEGILNLRGNHIPMVDSLGRPALAAFFSDSKTIVSTSRSSMLDIEAEGIYQLKLRYQSDHSLVTGASVRMFQTREMDQQRPVYLWNRLSPESLSRIGDRRVHGLTHISTEEQINIVRNRPVPLGPFGIEGTDYHSSTLYVLNDLRPRRRALIEPLGVGEIRCGPERRAVIGVPGPGGKVLLEINAPRIAEGSELILKYYGRAIHERETSRHELINGRQEIERSFGAGILEIESPEPITIRPWLIGENGLKKELRLNSTQVRFTRIETGLPATFSRSSDATPVSFRLVARPIGRHDVTLRYITLDRSGNRISDGNALIKSVPSLYDFELTTEGERVVNDPEEIILRLPSGVAAIRVECDTPCLVSGYLRPIDLVHHTRVPEDYDRALPDPDRLPIWFNLKPDHAEPLIRSHRSHLLELQPRPPVDDTDILAGRYQWEDYQPENGLGQFLLRERDPDSPTRLEALPSLFAPVSSLRDDPLTPASFPGIDHPSRRLAYFRDQSTPAHLTLLLDGQPFFQRRLTSARGEIPLPPFPDSFRSARVQFDSGTIQCYVNYVQPDSATRLKRRAQRVIPEGSAVYLCEKATSDEELLTGMWFAPAGTPTEARLSLNIEPTGTGGFLAESDSFTIRNRSWRIASNPEGITPLLGGPIPQCDGGRRFFIPLGRDMLPGTYRVTITCQAGPGGYLTLSKVLGGDFTEVRFFRDLNR